MISASCGSCGKRYQLKKEMAGRKAKCKCGSTIELPLLEPVAGGEEYQPSFVERCWDGGIAALKRSPRYAVNCVCRVWANRRRTKPTPLPPEIPASSAGQPQESSTATGPAHCGNCERKLGKLEQSFPWGQTFVCHECHQRLSAEHQAQGETQSPSTSSRANQSILTRPIDGGCVQPLAQGLVGIVVLVGVVWWIFAPSGGSKIEPPAPPALPTIRVVNLFDNTPTSAVTFRDWKVTGWVLSSTMVWKGDERISGLTFTARKNGTVVKRGDVSVPGGGMVKNEPTLIHINLWEEPTPDMEVTVEVAD